MKIIDNIQIEYWKARRNICTIPCMECKAYGTCQKYTKMDLDKETELKEKKLFWLVLRKIISCIIGLINDRI